LVENAIVEVNAKEVGVTVSDDEIQKKVNELNSVKGASSYDSFTEEQKKTTQKDAKKQLLLEKIKNKTFGVREGQYLFFRFDKYFKDNEETLKIKSSDDMVQKQKEHAQSLAQDVYKKLKAGEINFDQAIKIVNADSQISYRAFAPIIPNIYGTFSKEEAETGANLFAYQEFKDKVSGMKASEVSEPFVLKRETSEGEKDFAYIVVLVEKAEGGKIQPYSEWIQEQKQRLSVKIYPERIVLNIQNLLQVPPANAQSTDYCVSDDPVRGSNPPNNTNVKINLVYRKANNADAPYGKVKIRFWAIDKHEQLIDTSPLGIHNCENRRHVSMVDKTSYSNGLVNMRYSGGQHNYACDVAWGGRIYFPLWNHNGNTKGYSSANAHWEFVSAWPGTAGTDWINKPSNPKNGTDLPRMSSNWQSTFQICFKEDCAKKGENAVNGFVLHYKIRWVPNWKEPTGDATLKAEAVEEKSGAAEKDESLNVSVASKNQDEGKAFNALTPIGPAKIKLDKNKSIDLKFDEKPAKYPGLELDKIILEKSDGSSKPFSNGDSIKFTKADEGKDYIVKAYYKRSSKPQCYSLTATPSAGVEPLTVELIASYDTEKITNPIFKWEFGDGQTIKTEGISGNRVTHTYSVTPPGNTVQSVTAKVTIVDNNGVSIAGCPPATVTIRIKPWSESDWFELAP